MELTPHEMDAQLRHYEGLIFTSARRLVQDGVEQELEDVQQVLRVKAWKAIRAFSPQKARGMTLDRYVFMCVRDQIKDIGKRKRRGELHIEDIAPATGSGHHHKGGAPRDKFEDRYLSQDHEQTYHEVEDVSLTIPNTLSIREGEVLVLMYRNYRQTEIAEMLNVSKRDVESAVRGIRIKLADWRPEHAESEREPCPSTSF